NDMDDDDLDEMLNNIGESRGCVNWHSSGESSSTLDKDVETLLRLGNTLIEWSLHSPVIRLSSRNEISKPSKLNKSQHVLHPHKSVRENDIQESQPKVLRKRQAYMQLEDEDIQEEVQTESRDVPQPCKSSSRHEISKSSKLSKSQHVSHPHKSVREDDIQESQSKVLRKRQAYMQSEDQEIQEEALVDPLSGIELFDWVKLCDKFANEKFQKRREAKNVTAIDSYEIAHYCEKKKKMVSEEAVAVLNKLRSEEAAGSGIPEEICFKLLKRVPGHLRGRSAPKKEILVVENLRAIVESEKNKSTALEEKLKEVAVEQDEMKKCMGLMMQEIQRLSKLVPDKSVSYHLILNFSTHLL
ncbi:hypothetical protein Tco_0927870, partial [Tanacetum coccineum]